MSSRITASGQKIKLGVFLIAPVLFLYFVFFVHLDESNPKVTYTLAVAILMALWWVSEIVPLAITSLLPVATPPNAIVFGTNRLHIIDMSRTGFFLNIVGIIIVTLATYYLGTFIFNIQLDTFPIWAK